MAKITRKLRKNAQEKKAQKGFFSKIKFTESYTSLILGIIVVLVVGILFLLFAKVNRNMQTSSTKTMDENSQNSNTSSTYTVRPGDDLWSISENVYNDGYKWVEIAKLNKIENPGKIEVGDKLSLPKINQEEKVVTQAATQNTTEVTESNSITGSTYTVVRGDNLWNISVRAYGDGFKWVEIAKANNLANPSVIHSGNVFKIPR